MWAQGVHAVIRAILHQSEVCVVSRVGRQSAAQETTAGGQKWQGRDGWEAGAAEGAEAKQKAPGTGFIPEDDWAEIVNK